MAQSFDLIVMGTGAAGATVAHKCRAAGWQVAIIDSRPYGGTCALRGCDPKKVLVGAAELLDWQRRMQGYGIVAPDARIDWPELMRFKRTFTAPVPEENERSFTQAGIATVHGRAQFVDQTTVEVKGERLTGRFVVIANGARPRDLGVPGAELVSTSEQFLEWDTLPSRLIFIGGGYISFEFAHIAARAGATVTILHRGARPLEGFEPELVERLVAASRDLGISVRLNTEVTGVTQADGELQVDVWSEAGQEHLTADRIVHGAGRVPEIDDLDLERAEVERTAKGVTVNRYLQSVSNPAVYAAGDAADTAGLPLTPVATSEGHVVASNLLRGNHREPVYTGTPSVVFTIPALAAVGLREDEARDQGLAVKITHGDTSGWYSARRTREQPTGYKVLVEEGSGRILGAHLLGSHAEEVINLFALAIRHGLRAADLKQMIYAYPTSASDITYML
jgi:glutathione reductase (NADPH)